MPQCASLQAPHSKGPQIGERVRFRRNTGVGNLTMRIPKLAAATGVGESAAHGDLIVAMT
jgi:hypothetical protein